MADETPGPGRLIAVDGSRGADVAAEALALERRLHERGIACGISRWDASGLFADLLLAEAPEVIVSPRMAALLYAADLAFRLRWEIEPALAEGRVVIAAPYVQTAVAVGVGLGLPDTWMREVLRFAPAAHALRFSRERKRRRGWRPKPSRGFAEFCATVLRDCSPGVTRRKPRALAAAWLAAAAESGGATRRRTIVEGLHRYQNTICRRATPDQNEVSPGAGVRAASSKRS